ncbi:hypothetical protein [Thermococcus sp.]
MLFLALFAWSESYFVGHHMISIPFATISLLGVLRAYDTYKAGNSSRARFYEMLVLASAAVLTGIWIEGVYVQVLAHVCHP